MKIAIIGAGWNGIHTALELAKKGHLVTLYDSNTEILGGLSGNFGVRVHVGPHYPKSAATRKACHTDYTRFINEYKDIVVENEKSYYALGVSDAEGSPPRVDAATFDKVCKEFRYDQTIDLEAQSEFNSNNLTSLHAVREPSALVGKPLRDKLLERLQKSNIKIRCCCKATKVLKTHNKFTLFINDIENTEEIFDYVINSTGFQSLIPKEPLPFNMHVVSQVCAVTLVEDLKPKSDRPFSFTVMDGRYPCVMPYLNGKANQYIVYHSLHTIVGTFSSYQESWDYVNQNVDDQYLLKNVVTPSMCDLSHFIPDAKSRFKILGTKSGIVQKVDTNLEYRGPIVFQSPDGMIYSISAKITNVCSAADDVLFLVDPLNHSKIITLNSGYRYVPGGTLDKAKVEISEEKTDPNRTCAINRVQKPAEELLQSPSRYAFFNSDTDSASPSRASKIKPPLFHSLQEESRAALPEENDDSTPPDFGERVDVNKKRTEEFTDDSGLPYKRCVFTLH